MNQRDLLSMPEGTLVSPTEVLTVAVLRDVETEVGKAIVKFDSFNSPHEGWAVIREELDELWEHVKANTGRGDAAYREAVQVAAMAVRYAVDLCDEFGVPS